MAVEIIESNVDLIPVGKYTDDEFRGLLEKYRQKNTPSYPGATSSRIEDGSHIYLDNGDKLKIRRY